MNGRQVSRPCFAEYHANYSKNGSFMLRDGAMKLIYHVDMPSQLFDLENDPIEAIDMIATGSNSAIASEMERKLRSICNPEEVDRRAKADQRAKGDAYGGVTELCKAPAIKFTPPPGVSADVAWGVPK